MMALKTDNKTIRSSSKSSNKTHKKESEFETAAEQIEGIVLRFIQTHELDAANCRLGRNRDLSSALFNATPIPSALSCPKQGPA